jgi:uncharacterized protein YjbJ (UPF0337 family)
MRLSAQRTRSPRRNRHGRKSITGTAKNLGGKVEEGLGRIAGDAQTQLKGQAKQVSGAAEDLYGQAKDAASGFSVIVHRMVEQQPYTAVAIALAVGCYWAGRIGRSNRSSAARDRDVQAQAHHPTGESRIFRDGAGPNGAALFRMTRPHDLQTNLSCRIGG